MATTQPEAEVRHVRMRAGVLYRARLGKGMTLRDVSAECERRGMKIDPSNLSRAEKGLPGGIGARRVPVLAEVLGLTLHDLIPDEEREAA